MAIFHKYHGVFQSCHVELLIERTKEESPLMFAERSAERKVQAALYAGLWLCPFWSLASARPLKCSVLWNGESGRITVTLGSKHNGQTQAKSWHLGPGQSLEHVHGVAKAWGLAVSSVFGQMDMFASDAPPFDADR